MPPRIAAFPKCFMESLCLTRKMSVLEWIDLAATLGIDGLEFYSGFLPDDDLQLHQIRNRLAHHHLEMPMLCCSPDLTQPDPALLEAEIEREMRMIELTAFFGGNFCRVLSGQRRPGISRETGLNQVVKAINRLLPVAEANNIILTLENHYKDDYWQYPEFAQKEEIFLELIDRVRSPWFGVNFDPSNAFLAGEDPLKLLEEVKHRVVSIHASDRYLTSGTLTDLHREENDSTGYVANLAHGVIGEGLNDYDSIFSTLANVGFNSWISIEDGITGMNDLKKSVAFLREKISVHFK